MPATVTGPHACLDRTLRAAPPSIVWWLQRKERRVSDKATAVAAWESLFRAQVSVMRALNAQFPSGELSFNEYDVCFNLSRQPERRARMRELTEHLLLTQPSVSRLVDRLTARGIVEKSADPVDARGVVVGLTANGYALYRSVAVRHAATIAEVVGASLSESELRTLAALTDKLRAAVPPHLTRAAAPGRRLDDCP